LYILELQELRVGGESEGNEFAFVEILYGGRVKEEVEIVYAATIHLSNESYLA
jgi:hypothetical protein